MSSRRAPTTRSATDAAAHRVLYQGLLSSPASWARVGRGFLESLLTLDVPLAAVGARGFLYDEEFPLPPGLPIIDLAEARAHPPAVGIGFLHPPHLERLLGQWKANAFVWEADQIPPSWGPRLRNDVDLVLVPSEFTRDAVTPHVPASRVAVVPYGHDPIGATRARSHRAARRTRSDHDAPFTFLTVAAPHWRKGVREVLLAYAQSFTSADPVSLRIKTTYDPADSRRRFPFEIPSWEQLFVECGLRRQGAPPVELCVGTETENQLWKHYSEADVYLGPTWGESFGLAVLDALASGIPAIVAAWSGVVEFHPEPADQIPVELIEAGHFLYEAAPGARFGRPEVEALAGRMRWHFENQTESRSLGDQAQAAVAHRTWLNSARSLLNVLP